jgi:anhydro-N-acetylmuramic acid kinase
MQGLRDQLSFAQVYPFEQLGINPDAKEAIIFAVLGNETLRGKGIRYSKDRYLSLGKISFPD